MLGVDEDKFWDSTPVEMEPYRKMDKLRLERNDYEMWVMGMYVTNAVTVAVSNALGGRKSKAKYLDKPILSTEQEEYDPELELRRFEAWAAVYNENFKAKQGS
jgi:hypothetical protein